MAARFRLIHGDIRRMQQWRRTGCLVAANRDADAGAGRDHILLDT